MADPTLPDINWGGLAKLFMQSLDRQKDKGPSKKKKEKPAPKNCMRNFKTQPTQAKKPLGQPLPTYPLDPRHPQVILSQVQTLRMQLLQQLVYYQKQLLALQVPYIPNHRCCHTEHTVNKKGGKKKLTPLKFNSYENTQKWLKTAQVSNQNEHGQPKVSGKTKVKRNQKKCTKKANKTSKNSEKLQNSDCCVSNNNLNDNVSTNQQRVEHIVMRENNPVQKKNSKKRKCIKNKTNAGEKEAYERAVALERLRNKPLSTGRNQFKDVRSSNGLGNKNSQDKKRQGFRNNVIQEQMCLKNKPTTKPTSFCRKLKT